MTRRMLRAAVRRLATLLAAATLAVFALQVVADTRLAAPAPTAFVTDRQGRFITQAGHAARRPDGGLQVEYGYWPVDPSDRMVRATLALEDRRFWTHPGVDPAAVLRAVWQHVQGGRGSGASTIAMQVARMQHRRPRTLWAKAIEATVALAITARHGHGAVLAQYFRLAPYGEGSHGVAHAARWYFDKPAADLTEGEAALLSAIPRAPGRLAPRGPGLVRAVARARRAMAALDWPGGALDDVVPRAAPTRPAALQAVGRLAAMARPAGGLQRATLDLGVQAWVAGLSGAHLAGWRRFGAQQVAVMVVERGARAVLADVASAGYGSRPGGAIDYTTATRSPGSALKPFLYALALQNGVIAPQDVLADQPEGAAGVVNADRAYLGPLLPRQALANSRNVPAAIVLRRIGLATSFAFLRRLGVHHMDGDADRFGLAMAIGALPSSLEGLMRAYATLAEDGVDADLKWFTDEPSEPEQIIAADAARLVGQFLSDPLARLPSFPRYGALELPFAVALKTGTSQGYRDAWTFAWSRGFVVGVWVGRPDGGPMAALTGGRMAARLAQAVLLRLHGAGPGDLLAGALAVPAGRKPVELCPDLACSQRLTEWVDPAAAVAEAPVPHLAIVAPEPDSHVWRNPETPPALDRLVLRAAAAPGVRQIVWLVDGRPAAVAPPEAPLYWPLVPGRHRFQLRLPLEEGLSRPLTVVVE